LASWRLSGIIETIVLVKQQLPLAEEGWGWFGGDGPFQVSSSAKFFFDNP
jgi:hypothetical protein